MQNLSISSPPHKTNIFIPSKLIGEFSIVLELNSYISENRNTKFRPLGYTFPDKFINPNEFSSDEAWEAALAEAKAAADRAFEQENGENERRRIAEITSHMRSQGHEVTEWESAVFFADKNAADDKVAAEELAAEEAARYDFSTVHKIPKASYM